VKIIVIATLWASRSCSLQTTQCGRVQVRVSSARPVPAMATTKGLRLKQCRGFLSGRVQLYLIGQQLSRMPTTVVRPKPMVTTMQPCPTGSHQYRVSSKQRQIFCGSDYQCVSARGTREYIVFG
jgi:hypothetical protein